MNFIYTFLQGWQIRWREWYQVQHIPLYRMDKADQLLIYLLRQKR